jgi:hypothetical protein
MFLLKKEIFLNLLRQIIIKFYSSLIILNILVIKKVSKYKLLYSDLGFGDSFAYYVFTYKKITNINYKILTFSHLDHNNASFLFGNLKIIKNFFFIPKIFPIYGITSYLRNKKIFGRVNYKFHKYKINEEHKKIVENKLFQNIHHVSRDLFSLKKKSIFYFLLNITIII